MKKVKILLVCICLAFTASAQNAIQNLYSVTTPSLNPLVDTVTNTGVKTMTATIPVNGPRQTVTVSCLLKLISGTGAGTVTLQGSIDGITYTTIVATQLQGAQTASYTITNTATQAYQWVVLNNPYGWYRTTTTGSGTEVISTQGKFISR